MKSTAKFTLQKNQLLPFLWLWMLFCGFGAIFFHLFAFEKLEIAIPDTNAIPGVGALFFGKKEAWRFWVSSAKQELFFVLFLAFSTAFNAGIYIARLSFAVRGFLFGLGGAFLLLRVPFPLFVATVVRQMLLTIPYLFFAAMLYEKSSDDVTNDCPNTKTAFVLFYDFCLLGMSLLVHFFFLTLLVKNQWI